MVVVCYDENENSNILNMTPDAKVSDAEIKPQVLADSTPIINSSVPALPAAAPRKPVAAAAPNLVTEWSTQSRLSELARPRTNLAPSSAELERKYLEAKRQEMHDTRMRNEKSCHEAIHNPEAKAKLSSKVTVPKEFKLSRSNSRSHTPSRSVCSDNGSEMELDSDAGENSVWSTSLRGRSASRGRAAGPSAEKGPWQPKLTVPSAPQLLTSWRPRSVSRRSPTDESEVRGAMTPNAWSSSLRGRGGARDSSRSSSRASSRQGSAAPSPARSTRSTYSVRSTRSKSRGPNLDAPTFEASTPLRATSRGRGRSALVTPSPARSARSCYSARSCSDMSLASVNSRLSRRTGGSSRNRSLSTADLEEIVAQDGRRALAELMQHNARNYMQAINNPDMRRGHHSLDLTVPQEFHFSSSKRSSRSVCSSGSEAEDKRREWSQSLRRASESPAPAATAAWQPKLTAPSAPTLRTSSRASSRQRSSSRGAEKRSMSCQKLPPREQTAVERHLERTAAAQGVSAAESSSKPQASKLSAEDEQWIQAGTTAEERAERARQAMNKRREEAQLQEKQRLCVFRAPVTSNAKGSQSRGNNPLRSADRPVASPASAVSAATSPAPAEEIKVETEAAEVEPAAETETASASKGEEE
ncbi:unnamed protein product [Polarella glacialis]|uniref:Uncharacterized protein n=1 Tax=Polarella glacialis TaxID=89957 RepID=A0A813JI18_POLGL|nr:unnamed protein product [Polarella glacialis]